MDFRPPPILRWALVATRINQVVALLMLGTAVALEGPEVTSTWNFYYPLLGMPRLAFPALCYLAALISAFSASCLVARHSAFLQSVIVIFSGFPFILYCLGATFFVYGVQSGRTYVTFAMYWTAGGFYYFTLLLHLAISAWLEMLKLERKHSG